jgi:hypothetical protein
VILATVVLWDAIEVRVDDGAVYWRSDWDWELGGGGVTKAVAASALLLGPLLAAALVYSAVVLWGRPRTRRRGWATALYVVAVPFALLAAGHSQSAITERYIHAAQISFPAPPPAANPACSPSASKTDLPASAGHSERLCHKRRRHRPRKRASSSRPASVDRQYTPPVRLRSNSPTLSTSTSTRSR